MKLEQTTPHKTRSKNTTSKASKNTLPNILLPTTNETVDLEDKMDPLESKHANLDYASVAPHEAAGSQKSNEMVFLALSYFISTLE